MCSPRIIPAVVATFIIVMFLFYIDEGYYDFRWMRNVGNWLMFVVYLALVFPMQWLLAGMIRRVLGANDHFLAVTGLTLVLDVLVLGLVFFIL